MTHRMSLLRLRSPRKRPSRMLALEPLEDRLALSASSATQLLLTLKDGSCQTVQVASGATVSDAISAYQARTDVQTVEVDGKVSVGTVPNDTYYSSLWGMQKIGAATAWNTTTGSLSVTVAVIDTGVDYTCSDLYKNIWLNQGELPTALGLVDSDSDGRITFWDLNESANSGKVNDVNANGRIDGYDVLHDSRWVNGVDNDGNGYKDDLIGWNFVSNTNDPYDDNSHGTHVSGTIGAMGDNSTGVVGVNWKVQIAALKFLDSSGSGYTSAAVSALQYAVKMGIKISNNSWGGGGYSSALASAIASAQTSGHIFVAAAGNSSSNNDTTANYPSNYAYDNVVAVAATNSSDQLASFSSYGATTVDLAAPGVSILSTIPGGGYSSYSGTSMATPHVSGAIALVWSLNPSLTYSQVISRILSTVDKVSSLSGKVVTGGRLNLAAAIAGSNSDTTGPKVTSAVLNNTTSPSSVRLTFSEAIDTSTFTTADIADFTGPNGSITVTGVTAVSGSNNTQFDISFAAQTAIGSYSFTIGPNVADTAGNLMDQNANGATGESSDTYRVSFTIATDKTGPKVTAVRLNGCTSTSAVHLIFSEAIDVTTFTAADVVFSGPSGSIAVTSITATAGSNNTEFDINFATQSAAGTYVMTAGPNITDLAGNLMDQNGNGACGESSDSIYVSFTFADRTGAKVISAVANGAANVSSVRLTFSEAINPSTFTVADITGFTGPKGAIAVTGVTAVTGSNNTQFDVTFAAQTTGGSYYFNVGPNIADVVGNLMDQNANGVNGQATDTYRTAFTVVADKIGAKITSAVANSATSVSSVRLTFSEAINPSTFTTADITGFTGPKGALKVAGVNVVAGSNNTQFDVTFAAQTTVGSYGFAVGPAIADLSGNLMDQSGNGVNGQTNDSYRVTFAVPDKTGAKVTSTIANSTSSVTSVRVTFNEAIAPSTFTTADITNFTGPNGAITVTGVKAVAGSCNTKFDITFAAQTAIGSYSFTLGPNIADTAGNLMDQNGNGANGQSTDTVLVAFTVKASSATFSISGVTKIPSGKTVASVITINQDMSILDLDVKLNLTEYYDRNLVITLTGPNGTTVTLVNGRGGTGHHFVLTTLSDEATVAIANGASPFTGTYRPEQALSAFDYTNLRGKWTLSIKNTGAADVAVLNSWSLVTSTTLDMNTVRGKVKMAGLESAINQVCLEASNTSSPASSDVSDNVLYSLAASRIRSQSDGAIGSKPETTSVFLRAEHSAALGQATADLTRAGYVPAATPVTPPSLTFATSWATPTVTAAARDQLSLTSMASFSSLVSRLARAWHLKS